MHFYIQSAHRGLEMGNLALPTIICKPSITNWKSSQAYNPSLGSQEAGRSEDPRATHAAWAPQWDLVFKKVFLFVRKCRITLKTPLCVPTRVEDVSSEAGKTSLNVWHSSTDPGLDKGKTSQTSASASLYSLTTMSPAASCSCHHDFSTMMDWSLNCETE